MSWSQIRASRVEARTTITLAELDRRNPLSYDLMTELVDTITSFSSHVVALGKETFYRQGGLPRSEAYAITQPVMAENASQQHSQEGISAFLEKRRPVWPD